MRHSASLTPTALGWIREDLDRVLERARRQIEGVAINPSDAPTTFDGALETTAELSDLFRVLGADGPGQVSREMGSVLQAMKRGDVRSKEEALAALTDGMVVLPAYLDRLQSGHQDLPLLLLPLINRLREVADREALTEGTVFTPLLDVELPELELVRKPGFDEPFDFFTARLHRQYEKSLQNWLQDQSQLDQLSAMDGICETMRYRVQRYDLKRLWWVATEVIAGLMDGHLPNDIHLRRIMARLSLLIRNMSERGEDGIDERTSTSVTQSLLYQVSKASPGCKGVDLVRERFRLDELKPDSEAMMRARGTLSGRDREMYRSLSAAVEDELAIVKDALDLELRTGTVDREQRTQSVEALVRLGETLGMLGLSAPGNSVRDLIPRFDQSADADREDREQQLMQLAEQLLLVESALREQIETLGDPANVADDDHSHTTLSAHELRAIRCRVLDECVASLQAAEDRVRIRLEQDPRSSPDEPLEQATGALRLIGQTRAAEDCQRLLELIGELFEDAHREQVLARPLLETLADAMAALELFLAARRDLQADAERHLDLMEDRLRQLEAGLEPEAVQAEPTRPESIQPEPSRPEPSRPEPSQATAPPVPSHGATASDSRLQVDPLREAPAAAPRPPTEPERRPAPQTDLQSEGPARPKTAPEPSPRSAPRQAPQPHAERGTGAIDQRDMLPEPIDPELREIFLEEYEQVLEILQHSIPDWMNQLEDVSSLTRIRRAFHTLKGSGRMVGADELGDFSWEIENMLNALLEGRIQELGDTSMMVRLAQASLPALRQRMLQQEAGLTSPMIRAISTTAKSLAEGSGADWDQLRAGLPTYLANMLPEGQTAPSRAPEPAGDDAERLLLEDLGQHLQPVHEMLEAISRDRSTRVTEDQVRAIHTIAGALTTLPEGREADIARALEKLLAAQSRSAKAFTPDALFTMVGAVGELQNRLDSLYGQGEPGDPEAQSELITQLQALIPQFASIAADQAAAPSAEAEPEGPRQPREAPEFDPGRSVFAHSSPVEEPPPPPPGPRPPAPAPPPTREAASPVAQPVPAESTPAAAQEEAAEQIDEEILGIFLEEAQEVLDRADSALNEWRSDLNELSWVRHLQREIHTFKGGSRMAGLLSIGEFSHKMETLLERIAERSMPPSLSAVQVLEEACDRLQGWVERVAAGEAPGAGEALTLLQQQIQALDGVTLPSGERAGAPPAAAPAAEQEPTQTLLEPEASPMSAPPRSREEAPASSQIRVAAELLNRLVNASGEVSIYRSRIEQQVAGLRANLSEFDKTLDRLREQFRRLEIEIEVQIRSNYRDAAPSANGKFDPLELDQFSMLQQLSRGLSESVSDLLNLQEMLDENTRNSEQLLVKQSRVAKELQEGLMQTRMVPFGSIAARLRRIVRGSAKETGKHARLDLQLVGGKDELDRNVLEHITVPLEHMMRNAVVHGIEEPARRRAAGKPDEGVISLTIESEATEFVIRIADDGAGIDTDRIRARALERGLLSEGMKPSRQQLFEIMMNSGFSTTDKVTRLAGRGVGLDVATSEIKQIGGSLEVDSERGRGSVFTIRIPFTLAVMQAIGIVTSESRYLLPLSSVVGVSRLLPDDYRSLVESDQPRFRFAGQEYPLLDIEPLLGERSTAPGRDNVSLLVLAAGDQRAALRVPQLLPHREVVIKPVGPQISSIPGILGGSISGDGSVVVILDPGPLIRRALIHGVLPSSEPEWALQQPSRPLVMVIDDSITIRKVTSRVLKSQDYDVLTAKDGADALEQMQDRIPDIILCDIEMPRMDGYELTERVRQDARLRHIPILMITSRAGQKHRDRAIQAGADAYLTKPYQEHQLMEEVIRLMHRKEGG